MAISMSIQGQGKKWNGGIAEWWNNGMVEWTLLPAHHGKLCLARARAWKFMPCKGIATIEATEVISALA